MKRIKDQAYRVRVMILILIDILSVLLASILAIYIRYDFKFMEIDVKFMESIYKFIPINIIIGLITFFVFKLYTSIWKYASIDELLKIIESGIVIFLIMIFEMIVCNMRVPRSYPFMYVTILIVFTITSRFGYRLLRTFKNDIYASQGEETMIIGGGQAAVMLLKEIRSSKYTNYNVVCIIDDDKSKKGKYIFGVKIVGGRKCILEYVEKYNVKNIIIAMPSAEKKNIAEILEICKTTDCKLKKIPGLYQLINGNVSVNDIKDVEIEDLLGREPIKGNLDIIMSYVSGKVVMVTGGGGSIGSELCRQIAIHNPKQLIIVDIYENNAYDIQQELIHNYPDLNMIVLIASVRNEHRMNCIFKEYKPEIVYHAAAHKHVPLMETSPNEAIKNNVFGTYKTAKIAAENNVERFVLISTDKAVNPTNIMGASKRLCEMIIQMLNNQYTGTKFAAVRFGNVLGSNGSVIPLFKKQIKSGGPVTVTSPDVIRYFMTIPEAVSLVLQAGAYATGGEIFVLDMGEPVKILDLAKNLIKLSGYTEEEIEIKFTGLRPGEKMYEELLMNDEELQQTQNKMIHKVRPVNFDDQEFCIKLKKLEKECENDSLEIRKYVSSIIESYNV